MGGARSKYRRHIIEFTVPCFSTVNRLYVTLTASNDVIGMILTWSLYTEAVKRAHSHSTRAKPAFVPSTLCVDSGKRHLSVWSEISAILLCSESFSGKMAATPGSTVSTAPTLKEGWLQKRGEESGCGEGEDGRRLGVHLVGT